MSEKQRALYRQGILYYDIEACGTGSGGASTETTTGEVSGSVQDMAKEMLANDKITYWTNNGVNTRDVVKALSEGKKAYTTSSDGQAKEADINPNILAFILEVAKGGNKIMVNALTDKDHSTNSNHYKGLAVDLDIAGSAPLSVLDPIAKKYGGQKNDESTHHHYDFTNRAPEKTGSTLAATTDPSTDISKSVYMVGDSITNGATSELDNGLKSKFSSVYVNGSDNRSITKSGVTAGKKTSGLGALVEDKARVETSGTIIVALGTNQRDGNFSEAVKDMIKGVRNQIKAANKDKVEIFWVNVFSTKEGLDAKEINDTLEELSTDLDFNVIDTTKADIELKTDKVHPTSAGNKTFAEAVVNGLGVTATTSSNKSGGSCVCGTGDGTAINLSGSDNVEKVFNFFVSKGLKPFQAAGIIGNMTHESGVEPQRKQGVLNKKVPVEELSEADLSNTKLGWGIVQFTPPGKFVKPTKAAKKDPNDLAVQLEFVWQQLQGEGPIPEKQAGDELKATKNVAEAVLAFQGNSQVGGKYFGYERPGDQAGTVAIRTAAAKAALNKFGSGAGGGSDSSSGSSACDTDASGQVTGSYSLPIEQKFFTSNKVWFTKPHHDYPAADIPVKSGNKIFSVTAGKVTDMSNADRDGRGVHVQVTDSNGVVHRYFHGTPGSVKVRTGDDVTAGKLLMLSGYTGHVIPKGPGGAHLHYEIRIGNQKRCPQKLLEAIGEQKSPPPIKDLASSGCTN